MKILTAILFLFVTISLSAQDPDPRLFDSQWFLSSLTVEGSIIDIPNTKEVNNVLLTLSIDRSNTAACNLAAADITNFTSTSFTTDTWNILFEDCFLQTTIDFENFYFHDMFRFAEANVTFTYILEEVGAEGLRLTVINSDGDTAVYGNPALSIQEEQKVVVSIFPNPVKETLYIESNIPVVSAIVYNISGQKLLHTAKITNSNSIDVTVLPSGMYFITLVSETGQQQLQKFIKK